MREELNVFIPKEEFNCLKKGKINYAHFFNKKTLIEWIGHLYENKAKEVIIEKINLQDENFFLKDLIKNSLADNSLIIKTISFNEWLCLKNQGKVVFHFLEKTNFQKDQDVNLITIKIFEKMSEKIIEP